MRQSIVLEEGDDIMNTERWQTSFTEKENLVSMGLGISSLPFPYTYHFFFRFASHSLQTIQRQYAMLTLYAVDQLR